MYKIIVLHNFFCSQNLNMLFHYHLDSIVPNEKSIINLIGVALIYNESYFPAAFRILLLTVAFKISQQNVWY